MFLFLAIYVDLSITHIEPRMVSIFWAQSPISTVTCVFVVFVLNDKPLPYKVNIPYQVLFLLRQLHLTDMWFDVAPRTCSEYDNHSNLNSQRNCVDLHDHLTSTRIVTLIMKQPTHMNSEKYEESGYNLVLIACVMSYKKWVSREKVTILRPIHLPNTTQIDRCPIKKKSDQQHTMASHIHTFYSIESMRVVSRGFDAKLIPCFTNKEILVLHQTRQAP